MTNKQIIIDGVDVCGCENYIGANTKTHNCTLYDGYLRPCKNADCYYKQLKRAENQIVDFNKKIEAKEQECEFSNLKIIQLQETLSQYETDLSTKDCIVETCKAQYKELKAELEQYKDLAEHNGRVCNERLDKIDELEHDINELNGQLDQAIAQREAFWAMYRTKHGDLADKYEKLKAENEELKKSILQECPNCGEEYLNYKGVELYYENNDLEQTLIEIKEVLQFYNNSTIGVDKGNGIFEIEVSNDNIGKLIYRYDTNPAKKALQKISECEVENESN